MGLKGSGVQALWAWFSFQSGGPTFTVGFLERYKDTWSRQMGIYRGMCAEEIPPSH